MKKRVSLKDIAAELGISITLVSYVMNDKEKEGRVGAQMAKKIRETAKRLNYQPHYIARSLRNNKTQTIGLVVADISNPFFANLARIVEDEASRFGYTVIIGSSDEDPKKMERVLNIFKSRQVDGFVIVPTEGSLEQIRQLKEDNIPFVLLDRFFDEVDANYVCLNNFQASFDATRYLLQQGLKKVGIISYHSNLNHFADRVRGYQEALRSFGIDPKPGLMKKVRFSNLKTDIEKVVLELIQKEKVDGVYFTTNTIALESLKNLLKLGIKIPEELGIMAFDHSDAYFFFQTPVPHVHQPMGEMGKEVVQVLVDQIEGQVSKIKRICLDASLKSCCE